MYKNKTLIVSIVVAVCLSICFMYLVSTHSSVNIDAHQYDVSTTDTDASILSTEVSSISTIRLITKEELSKHVTVQDCWTSIGGKVYDLTLFITEHPGGRRAILDTCGKDASADFSEAHGKGGQRHMSVFAKYYIGVLNN